MKEYSYLHKGTIEYINSLITIDNFSEELFDKWLLEKNIEFMSNPNGYVMKVFKNLLNDNYFKPREKVLTMIPLFNLMRSMKIRVYTDDTEYISLMEKHLIFSKQVTIEELKELNNKAVEYIAHKKEKPSTKDFIEVFRKSKRHFDLTQVDKERGIKNARR